MQQLFRFIEFHFFLSAAISTNSFKTCLIHFIYRANSEWIAVFAQSEIVLIWYTFFFVFGQSKKKPTLTRNELKWIEKNWFVARRPNLENLCQLNQLKNVTTRSTFCAPFNLDLEKKKFEINVSKIYPVSA